MTWQELYKGDVEVIVTFSTGGNSALCGIDLTPNEDYLIGFYSDDDGNLYGHLCGLLLEWDTVSDETLKELEECSPTDFEYMGCFTDKSDERVLDYGFDSPEMTTEVREREALLFYVCFDGGENERRKPLMTTGPAARPPRQCLILEVTYLHGTPLLLIPP